MYPILFNIGSFPVRAFDVLVVLGMVSGGLLTLQRARSAGLGGVRTAFAIVTIILAGLFGSRVGVVLASWRHYWEHPSEIFTLYGTSIQSALVVGALVAVGVTRWLGVSFWQLGDLAAPGIILGQALGRIGCLLNGCCHGRVTDSILGLYLPDHAGQWAVRYPTQAMHVLANLAILALLLILERRAPFEGFTFLMYALFFSAQRLLIDFLREVGPTMGDSSVRYAQAVSVATMALAGVFLVWRSVHSRPPTAK